MSKKRVFVVMPFSKENRDIWKIGIQETVESLGFECIRADEIVNPGFIVDQIYDQIAQADIVIGEMTGRNPNVFYEIGFAHALGKPTILLAKSVEDLHVFDTQGFRHFLHDGSADEVREILKKTLTSADLATEVWPIIPNGRVIYEWPSPEYQEPGFKWQSHASNKEAQIDVNGGQSIVSLDPIGKAILISNTEDNWNWWSGNSIMTLIRRTNQFSVGDSVVLLIKGRSTGAGRLELLGDGGYADPNDHNTKWVNSWKPHEVPIGQDGGWTTWVLKTEVQPTDPNYDPAQRGTTVYLISSIGKATVFLKRIQLIHVTK